MAQGLGDPQIPRSSVICHVEYNDFSGDFSGLQSPGHKGFAMSAILVSQVMSTTLSLSVEVCTTFVIDTLD